MQNFVLGAEGGKVEIVLLFSRLKMYSLVGESAFLSLPLCFSPSGFPSIWRTPCFVCTPVLALPLLLNCDPLRYTDDNHD